MRTLVIYYSKTGSTQKYAEEIAQALKADIVPFKKFNKKMIGQYDTFIFGARVMGSRICKADQFLMNYELMKDKNIIMFAVGMSVVTSETRKGLISGNLLDMYHIRFYQLRGSFNYENLSFIDKLIMNNSFRLIAHDPNASVDQKSLLSLKETPIIVYDSDGVNKIINIARKIETEVPQA